VLTGKLKPVPRGGENGHWKIFFGPSLCVDRRAVLFFGDGRYRRIKGILNAALDQAPLPEAAPAAKPASVFVHQRPVAEFFGPQEATC